ncbi:MAG: hypothetical protein A2V88_09285 [Elusimicrobia bacterium RBG_16_66_12]|nr:MAG: hypothetical protein A2V88_09285 [Elusimicrobia bacterium RBG_16_66_12]
MSRSRYRPTTTFLRRLGLDFGGVEREDLFRIDLNAALGVIGLELVTAGSRGRVRAKASEIFRGALSIKAAEVVLVHFHPSGSLFPSGADRAMTERLRLCGQLLGVPLHDHLIIAGDAAYSFKDSGFL